MKMHRRQDKAGRVPGKSRKCSSRVKPAWLGTGLMLLILISADHSQADERHHQYRLVMGYYVSMFFDAEPKDVNAALMVYNKEIGRERGAQVDTIFYPTPAALAEAFLTEKVDFAVFTADDYVRLDKKPDFAMGLTSMTGGKKTQRFLIFVQSGAPYHYLQDLRGRKLTLTKGLALGRLYLDTLLLKQNLPEAAKYFSLVNETVRPAQVILALFFGQSDLCVVNERNYNLVVELNPQVKERLRLIATSPEYVLGVGIFRKTMPPQVLKAFQNALLNLGDSPRGKQVLTIFKSERFTPVQPGELESVRQLVRENEALKIRQ